MKLSNLRPFVPSGPNFQKSKEFFLHIGFKENWSHPDLSELQFGEVIFLLQNYANKELQENLMLYVNVDDLDSFWEHLNKSNIKELFPTVKFSKPEVKPWGIRELHLIDPAGVCWHFSKK